MATLNALIALALQIQPFPADALPDGARLEEGQMCYTLAIDRDGSTRPIGRSFQVVRRDSFEDRPVLWVLVHQQLQNGAFDVRDEFVLEPADLRPIRYVGRRNGTVRVDLSYGDDGVAGYRIDDQGRRTDIVTPLRGRVWEGNLWGLVFAAMPLREDRPLSLPFWHHEKGFGRFSVRVVGTETVSAPDGPTPAWIVEATDGSGPTITYRIGRDRGVEISNTAGAFTQTPGGDCSGIQMSPDVVLLDSLASGQ